MVKVFHHLQKSGGIYWNVLELSQTHFNGFIRNIHLIPINPNFGIIWDKIEC